MVATWETFEDPATIGLFSTHVPHGLVYEARTEKNFHKVECLEIGKCISISGTMRGLGLDVKFLIVMASFIFRIYNKEGNKAIDQMEGKVYMSYVDTGIEASGFQ